MYLINHDVSASRESIISNYMMVMSRASIEARTLSHHQLLSIRDILARYRGEKTARGSTV